MLARPAAHRFGLLLALAALTALPVSRAAAQPAPRLAAPAGCEAIAAPPRRLATQSKYDPSFASKSVLDPAAFAARRETLAPVTAAIARLAEAAADPARSACAAEAAKDWARAAALTDMASNDANLSRDRFTVEIVAALSLLKKRGHDLSQQPEVRAWLGEIAGQTMRFYDFRAGSVSRRNNHRYWAGLAVGSAGYFLGDAAMTGWARRSFEAGACQIGADGTLPLELARGEKALEYHLYAYRALAGLRRLAAENGDGAPQGCAARLTDLERLLAQPARAAAEIEALTGARQEMPRRWQAVAAPAGEGGF